MDCGIIVDPEGVGSALHPDDERLRMGDRDRRRPARASAFFRPRSSSAPSLFEFMSSAVSSEKPKGRDGARNRRRHETDQGGRRENPGRARPGGRSYRRQRVGRLADPQRLSATSCSPAMPWRPTTWSRPSTAPAWASRWNAACPPPRGTNTILRTINTIRRLGGIAQGSHSKENCRAASCTSASRTKSRSCWPAASATTARCPKSSPTCCRPRWRCENTFQASAFALMMATTLAFDRHRQSASRLGQGGVRRHQSWHGDKIDGSRQHANHRHRQRCRAVLALVGN